MPKINKNLPFALLFLIISSGALSQTKLPECKGEDDSKWNNCYGALVFSSGGSFSWNFKNGKADGFGVFKPGDGDVYIGQFKNNKRHGQGIYTHANGDKYEGQYIAGEMSGQGTYTFANGDKYVGQWKNDKYDGQGSFTFANGEKYVGQYKNDKRDGQGVLTYKAGGSYSGQWKDNLTSGRGTYTDENGVKLVGIWAEGKLIKDESPKPPPPKLITLSCIHENGRMAGLEVQYFIDEQNNSVIASRGSSPSNVVVAPTLIIFNQDTASVSINRVTGKFSLVIGSTVSSGTCQLLNQAKPKF